MIFFALALLGLLRLLKLYLKVIGILDVLHLIHLLVILLLDLVIDGYLLDYIVHCILNAVQVLLYILSHEVGLNLVAWLLSL